MANADRPRGFTPVGTIDGSPYNSAIRTYPVDVANATAIFPGDAVTLEADGNVAAAGSTSVILGVCVGVEEIGRAHV